MNKRERMYDQIKTHGDNLNKIFHTQLDNITLSKKLFRLENKGNRIAMDYCNGDMENEDFETQKDKILKSVDKILNFSKQNIPVFFNSDPRGYALKIKDDYTRDITIYRDCGGYVLAPDFSE